MNESYAEAGVKRRSTIKTILFKSLLISITVLLLVVTVITSNSILLPVAAILVVAIIYFIPRLNIEYEYVFVDGQLDIDKIMGGAKRKTAIRIDFDNVEMIAPEGSHALDSFHDFKVRNYTSLQHGVKPYAIIAKNGEEKLKILFEPTEKMLEVMKNKSPRKIVNY